MKTITLANTWIEEESAAYPHGRQTRRGRVVIRQNTHAPSAILPYGRIRAIRCGIPDTYFSIPAHIRYRGKTTRGFVSVVSFTGVGDLFAFTPNATRADRT